MNKKKVLSVLAVLVCLIALGSLSCQSSDKTESSKELIASGHPAWPPIMYQKGDKIVGAGPELFAKIFQELGVKAAFKYEGPWDQVQAKAKSGSVDVLVAAYKTPERETYMKYSIPYTVDPVSLVIKKGNVLTYNKWEDLIGKKGVVMVGDSYGADFDKFMAQNLTVVKVGTPEEAVALLEKEEADYFVYALYSAEAYIFEKKASEKIEIVHRPVATENFYLTISKKSSFIGLMPEINKLLKQYEADGTIQQLIDDKKKSLWGE
jgi:polar amino acid transport system substrate-binding protein